MRTAIFSVQHMQSRLALIGKQSKWHSVFLVLGGVILLSLAAQVDIPFGPVPFTLQSAAVIFLGLSMGSRLALATVLSYLILGGFGLPIYAEMHAGLSTLLGSNGGYLFAFLPAAYLTGKLMEYGFARNVVSTFVAAVLSDTIIFILGYIVLAAFIGWHNAYIYGVKVFLITEPIKLAVLSVLCRKLWREQQSKN